MKIIPSIVTLLFLIAAGTVSSPAQNATTVEPLLVYKALQDKDCRHWVDSVMDKLSFKEKVGQLFIYTIAPVDTKRNLELLREVIDTYKVGGLLFSGGKMQNQVELTNRAQRQAKVPLMITFDGEWGWPCVCVVCLFFHGIWYWDVSVTTSCSMNTGVKLLVNADRLEYRSTLLRWRT